VFNPGQEAVEGFSSPLWVLLLGACSRLGLSVPGAALGLSLLATLALFGGLVRLTWLALPEGSSRLWVLLPAFLLAITRSVAVWSSGGLETRFFEALVLWTLLRLWSEARRAEHREVGLPMGGALLGLLVWTRPEGAMFVVSVPLALWLAGGGPSEASKRWLRRTALVALLGTAGLFLARYLVFGELLPNTYYAKLDGRMWWRMGLSYLAMFALEYGAVFWLPLVGLGLKGMGGIPKLRALILGFTLPLILYVASIGGDHFEYRPLDLLFPYAYLLLCLGAIRAFLKTSLRVPLLGLLLLCVHGIWALPSASRASYPKTYQAGFPGLDASPSAQQFPTIHAASPYRAPLLSQLAAWHRQLLQYTSRHFVGLRQEEHRMFFALVESKGKRLKRLIEKGALPGDLYVALDCVGAIPYHSNLRVLDRLGLTDRATAHAPYVRAELSAHGKYASLGQAQESGVDLWALHPTMLLFEAAEPGFQELLASSQAQGQEFGIAEIEPGLFLVAWLPQGLAETQARWPKLGLQSTLRWAPED